MGEDPNRPRIISQSYDSMTRRGSVVFDTAGCENPQLAIAWVRSSYLPLLVSTKGAVMDVSADDEVGPPPGRLSVTGFKKESPVSYRIDFVVLE